GVALEDVLARRVSSLSGAERALVEVLAVANSPIPLSVGIAVARVPKDRALHAITALSRDKFVHGTGVSADDEVELHHDRLRESVIASLAAERVADLHFALGRELAARVDGDRGAWIFDAVRHLNVVTPRLVGADRTKAARLDLEAGRRARRAAAFP